MPVPNIFAGATSNIPLSQLDQNFATNVTIGITQVGLGNSVASISNVALANSGNIALAATSLFLLNNPGVAPAVSTSTNGSGAAFTGAGGGLQLQGKGSGSDVQLLNSLGSSALSVPTGTLNVLIGSVLITGTYTYNTLPTAIAGGRIYVTDSGQTGFGTQLDGATSGASNWPAWSDGSHWFIG